MSIAPPNTSGPLAALLALLCISAFAAETGKEKRSASFSVKVSQAASEVTVLEGAVKVRNARGRVEVQAGSQVAMRSGAAPSPPRVVDAKREIDWVSSGPLVEGRLGNGLVGYWKFDEGGGAEARDSSPYGHHGRLNGPVWTTGVVGGALEFDGSGAFVDIGDPPALELTGSLTLCAWLKIDTFQTNGRIICKQDGPGRRGWSMNVEDWKIVCMQVPWDASRTVSVESPPVSTGVWMYVVTVYDAGRRTMKFYLNGSLTGTRTDDVPGIMHNADLDVRIGGRNGGGCFFDGTVDEVRIYDRPLDAAEVAALYRLSGGGKVE